ncbi:MAG: hypothetical protein HUK01_04975 [Bacteroidaceae bacterium]|nr:hypothetical protein [Bacteroidaceae bacterium]MCF0183564.1 hypothetical protein [Bacteroidaceae bacterium]MCF0183671.1 hypothetical protein [Bacteroidaceae bacterium]
MRKLFNYLLAMPLLMLAACSSEADNTPAPSAPTYTMTGKTGAIDSRVTYKDESNTMNCCWEKGDTVTLKADGGGQTYDFVVTSVKSDGVGMLSYEGAIPSADNFTGTATYAPRNAAKAGIQIANDNTEHLKYGETMVATLTNQQIEGASLTFKHPETAIYKVKFNTPVAFTAGSKLSIVWEWWDAAELTLDFDAKKDETVTAYFMHIPTDLWIGEWMKFVLTLQDGRTCSYKVTGTKKDMYYDAGKYWIADITGKMKDDYAPEKFHVTVTSATASGIALSFYVTDPPVSIDWYEFSINDIRNGYAGFKDNSYIIEDIFYQTYVHEPLQPGTEYKIKAIAQDKNHRAIFTWEQVVKTAEAAN